MDTQQIIELKKQRIQEGVEKLIPPGFSLSKYPSPEKRTSDVYVNLDKFYGIDQDVLMQVGYLQATKKDYDDAITHLRFFGGSLGKYKDFLEYFGTGFPNGAKLRKDVEEACDYMIRFYELAKIVIKQADEEVDYRIKQNQKEREKLKAEEEQKKKAKATKFVSGATSFRPGTTIKVKTTKIPGIVPKSKLVPKEVVDSISKTNIEQQGDKELSPRRVVSTLGRVTLDLEAVENNLEKIAEILLDDYKNTKENNKKEIEEYRKRVTNRGRRIGRRELGDDKKSLKDILKKYVGGFFTGTGGAIRALALFNMLEAFANNKPLQAIGPLLGIGATYLPAIGQAVGGIVAAKVLKGMFVGGGRGAVQGAKVGAGAAEGAKFLPKLGKLGLAGLGIGAGAFAISKMFGSGSPNNDQQTRLGDLTREQKGLVSPEDLVPIPQDDLKRFENLNNKFEKALDFLIGKRNIESPSAGAGAPTQPTEPTITPLDQATQLSAGQYKDIINQASRLSGIPASQIAAMGSIESTFDPNAVSKSGAMGIMQLMPSTYRGLYDKYGKKYNLTDKITDPQTSITLGALYMRDILSRSAGGSLEKMVKMYNAGEYGNLSGEQPTAHWEKFKKALPKFSQLERGLSGMNLAPSPTVLPPEAPTPAVRTQPARQYQNITIVPSSASPTIVPFMTQPDPEPLPMSMSDEGNNTVRNVSTTYYDNFLALYSRLIYQIV